MKSYLFASPRIILQKKNQVLLLYLEYWKYDLIWGHTLCALSDENPTNAMKNKEFVFYGISGIVLGRNSSRREIVGHGATIKHIIIYSAYVYKF